MRALMVLSLVAVAACSGDSIDPPWGSGGAGGRGTGGAAPSTATGSEPVAGSTTVGATASTSVSVASGPSSCDPGEKLCGKSCVSIDDPTTGCGSADCSPCPTPHAVAQCANQVCAVGECVGSWRDCDANQANGCEADTMENPYECGSCGHECTFPNAALGPCGEGVCSVGACFPGYSNCDGVVANGCEKNLIVDEGACGACGNACLVGQVCDGGACRFCGVTINPVPYVGQISEVSAVDWIAMAYTPKSNEAIAEVCLNLGMSSDNGFPDLWVLSDINGIPGAPIAKGYFKSGGIPAGLTCVKVFASANVLAHLVGGVQYWISTNVRNVYGPEQGTLTKVFKSGLGPKGMPPVWIPLVPDAVTLTVKATCE